MGRQERAIENAAAKSAAKVGALGLPKLELPPRRVPKLAEALAQPGMRLITAEAQGLVQPSLFRTLLI